jgi:hypothetical protein
VLGTAQLEVLLQGARAVLVCFLLEKNGFFKKTFGMAPPQARARESPAKQTLSKKKPL